MMATEEMRRGRLEEFQGKIDEDFRIEKANLRTMQELGRGNFGIVRRGKLRKYVKSVLQEKDVAVKQLKKCPDEKSQDDFITEAINMQELRKINNPHIVTPIGICLDTDSEDFMIVTELAPLGDLPKYLKEKKERIGVHKLLEFCLQIAKGMNRLEEENVLHRDLALRNILVAAEDQVKISDFGLSRLTDYYKARDGKWPIKWYAPESLKHNKFTTKSDVWSYGVTVWEMFNYGELKPYPDVDNSEILDYILKGNRLPQPENCPDGVYEIMKQCWDEDSRTRPSFFLLYSYLIAKEIEKLTTDETITKEDTIPTEILARGPEALKAYKEALQSGKTKNRRLLVMVVGPARVGKTSLLKSLNGEKFEPSEDSTDGIQLQHTFCKPQENCWNKDSDKGISYTDCMADIIHENLRGENVENIAEATKEPIAKSVESSKCLKNNDADDDDADNDNDDDDNNKASKAESVNKETNNMKNQENISWESTRNLPKAIEEKLLMKLKDTESDKTKVNELYIKTLDHAGQAVYNVIHPIFLTSKAVFILVYNLKNILHVPMKSKVEKHGSERELVDPFEMTNLENLELWLSCISSYTDAERRTKVDELSLPPVFIVGTHADKFNGNLEAAKQIIREIYKCLSPSKNPSGFHVKRDEVYTVNNRISGNGEIRDESVRKLKSDIEELSKSLPHMKEDIPLHWLLFEEELSSLVEKESKKYITIDEAMKIANKCKVNTSAESKEFTTLLNYLHDLKTIIYFEESKIVFIDTQWLVKVFTKVIEVRVAEKRGGFDKFWDKLEEEGILERALVEHVWKGLVDEQNTIDSLLLIMEKFSLICRWNTSEEEEEVYLVPCMLCNSKKRDDIAMFLSNQKTSTMVIRFNTSHVSLGIFPRLFVAIAEEGKKEWPNLRQPKLCKNFCRIFNVGKETSLDICVIQSSIRTISVTVCNKQNIDGQRVTEFCQHFRKLLDQIFDRMRHNFPWMQSMKFEYGILCPVCASSPNKCESHGMEGCTRDSCLHFVNEEELILDRPECCEDVAHLDNVIKEEAYSYWFPKKVVGSTLTFNLTENQKRWLVIGICLNIVLLPPVRKFLEQNILNHYTNLKASNHIDNQVHGGHLVNDGKCRALNYRSINNNNTMKGEKNYDYNVTSAVDLAKLYLQPHMAKFTGFDNTCDLSAVLGILSMASVFSSDVQDFSSKVRGEVRNEWGHCNVQSWDETKFADCFKLMHSLLKALKLSSDDEKTIADQLTDWENKGVEICMANKVQPELVKDIEDKVTQLSREFQLAFSRNEENIGQLSEDVQHLALHQKEELCTVLETLQTVQDAVQSLKQRMGLVEERLGKVEDKVGRVDEKCDRLYDQVKVLEARELKKC